MNKKIILNHKSYLNYEEILNYKEKIEKIKCKEEIIIFPSLIYLSLFKNSKYEIGAQNFYSYNYGSYTGEINLESLKYLNIKYTLVGHSERIKFKLYDKKQIKEKLYISLNANFKTILCVGEMNKVENAFGYIKKQLNYYLKNISSSLIKNLSIAYEPSWAIGGKNSLEFKKIAAIIEKIKKYFNKKYDINIEVYYGGSVNEDSIKSIIEVSDGVLIGKISSDISKIKDIIDKIC